MRATIDHVGIAVAEIGEALRFYRDALGLEIGPDEAVVSQRVRVRFVPPRSDGEPALELIEPTAGESPLARFLAGKGPGLHHVALRVDDLAAALAELKARGVRLIDESPRPGAHGTLVAFVHPGSTHGVLVELLQRV